MNDILLPAIYFGGISLFLGAALSVASVIFKVDTDNRISEIVDALPGANCGGCGYTGCAAYAKSVVERGEKTTLCPVGGKKVQDEIAQTMGVECAEYVEKKAVVKCGGYCSKSKAKYNYDGILDCAAANRVANGPKSCQYGCMGLGTCVSVCKFGAISIVDGIAVIDALKCTSCSTCANSCPKGVIEMKPLESKVYINCQSMDKGAATRQYCTVGCIGCRACERVCSDGAVLVIDNVANIDYDKCTNCGKCVEKCPVKCIETLTEKSASVQSDARDLHRKDKMLL